MFMFRKKTEMPDRADALPGRATPLPTARTHFITHHPLKGPYPAESATAVFGLGCFWGAERKFWELGDGIHVTAAGYAGGPTPNPTYEEVCSGQTGHTETVRVCFDPAVVAYADLVRQFFEAHDPTQGFRQGNDVGTQYRSALFVTPEQEPIARELAAEAQQAYSKAGFGELTTQIAPASAESVSGEFFFAEDYHQQYLVKNPTGYCPIHATGVKCG